MIPTARCRSTWPAESAPRPNKFRAIRTKLDGIMFDSKRESVVYAELRVREKLGEIVDFRVHPQFDLTINGTTIAKFKADFAFKERDGRYRVVDVKSPATAKRRDFILVRKLMKAVHGIEVEVWQ